MRAWMNKNTELQEKFNNGTLIQDNAKAREEKEKKEKLQDEATQKTSEAKHSQNPKVALSQTLSSDDTKLTDELKEWQQDLSLIKSSGQFEQALSPTPQISEQSDTKSTDNQELRRQIEALKELNNKIIETIEINRQNHEASQQMISDSFKQIIDDKNKELEQKSYEVQELKGEVANLQKESDKLLGDYNALNKSKIEESYKFKSLIEQQESQLNELQAQTNDSLLKLHHIRKYAFEHIDDVVIVNEIEEIISPDTKISHSLFEDQPSLLSPQRPEQAAEKIPVKEITIVRLEGPSYLCDIENKVYSFDEANKLLKEMSKKSPRDGSYDKTNFKVEFIDGEKYEGRIDLMHYTVEKNSREQNIEQHIHDHLSFYNGTLKPDHMSLTQYDDFLSKNTTKDSRQEINAFLDKYIPDEAKHPRIQSQELEQLKPNVKSSEKSIQNQSSASQQNQHSKDKSKSKSEDGGLGY
jgi:hypothetical protein